MTLQAIVSHTRAKTFETVAEADQAIRRLLVAGFSKDQLAVICPDKFKDHFRPDAPQAEGRAGSAGIAIATDGAVGATLGGLALAASVITGGIAGEMTAVVLVGGGAIAGGFSNLVISKGYEHEADDYYKHAIERGQIVVGVEIQGDDSRLAQAQRILDEAGARQLLPAVE